MGIAWDAGAGYFLKFVAAMVLLFGAAFFIGLRVRRFLSGRSLSGLLSGGAPGNVAAAGFGAITPFCSCTTVPIFAGMLEADVRLSQAMAFLIASPTLNPPALVLLLVVFGWRTTLLYVAAVFAVAVVGGTVLGGRRLQGYVYEVLLLIPIAHALVSKCIPDGTVLAFTMAASGLGIPTLLLPSRVVHRRLIGLYVLVVTVLLIGVGYLLSTVT
jgi:uncharacterized membrane protein YraQ (UPF0718 family)